MQITSNILSRLPACTKLELLGYSCDQELIFIGMSPATGCAICVEEGKTVQYQPEYITGKQWSVYDPFGCLIPSSDLSVFLTVIEDIRAFEEDMKADPSLWGFNEGSNLRNDVEWAEDCEALA